MNPSSNRSSRRIDEEAARWVSRNDAGLSVAERDELECWLSADLRHAAAFRQYQSSWTALGRPACSGTGSVLEREVRGLSRHRHRRIIAVSALVAMLFVAGVFRSELPLGGERGWGRAMVVVPEKQTLPDGSVVEIRAEAKITPDYQTSHRRVVLEQGTAYFSVQSDPARPFTVQAGGVEVRAVGTEFSVQITPGRVEVLVSEGSVQIGVQTESGSMSPPTSPVNPSVSAPANVTAGHHAVVDLARSDVPEVTAVDDRSLEEMLAWRSLGIDFTRTSLAEAVELLNAHAPPGSRRLVIGDERAGAMRVTGLFRPSNIDAFVLLLEKAFGIRAQRSDDRIVLHAEP